MEKIKALCFSLLPTLMWYGVQIVVSIPFVLLFSYGFQVLQIQTENGFWAYIHENGVSIMSVCIDAAVLVPGFFWLGKLRQSPAGSFPREEKSRWKLYVQMIFAGIAIQLLVDLLLYVLAYVAPQSMEAYSEVMENLGMFSPTFFSVLYTGVLAPIAEELLYRGLTFRILRKSLPFATANIIQAFLFGLIHGNLIQGGYAFFVGLLLGYITEKRGSLKAAVLCHAAVNVSGLLGGGMSISQTVVLLLAAVTCVFLLERRE